jgi:hypothetical protein
VGVDLEYGVQRSSVQREDAGVAVAVALDAGDDARAAAVRYDGNAFPGGPVDDSLDVALVSGSRDEVRRGGEVAVEPADDVTIALPVGVTRPGPAVGRHDGGQLVGHRKRRGGQLDLFERRVVHDRTLREPERALDPVGQFLTRFLVREPVRVAPRPETQGSVVVRHGRTWHDDEVKPSTGPWRSVLVATDSINRAP